MMDMAVKKSAAPPREGTASAVRAAARSSVSESATSPERPKRRRFEPEYKLRIVRAADAALESGVENAVGDLLRREGLYSSHLSEWRQLVKNGQLAALAAKKRGRKPRKNRLGDELAKAQREIARLKVELAKANTVIDVQKKVSALLGHTLAEPTEEELAQAPHRFQPGRLDIKSGRR
jgi:transposase-like protein